MFSSENRLRNDKDIKTLFARGKNNLSTSRFAIVVGVKVSKKAVDRNRLKRRIRGIVEKHLGSIAIGYDVMFLVKKEAMVKTTPELEVQILRAFKRAKLV